MKAGDYTCFVANLRYWVYLDVESPVSQSTNYHENGDERYVLFVIVYFAELEDLIILLIILTCIVILLGVILCIYLR